MGAAIPTTTTVLDHRIGAAIPTTKSAPDHRMGVAIDEVARGWSNGVATRHMTNVMDDR